MFIAIIKKTQDCTFPVRTNFLLFIYLEKETLSDDWTLPKTWNICIYSYIHIYKYISSFCFKENLRWTYYYWICSNRPFFCQQHFHNFLCYFIFLIYIAKKSNQDVIQFMSRKHLHLYETKTRLSLLRIILLLHYLQP